MYMYSSTTIARGTKTKTLFPGSQSLPPEVLCKCCECRELMTRVRGQDVQLLKAVGVELICDLMVEKKKTKYGLL